MTLDEALRTLAASECKRNEQLFKQASGLGKTLASDVRNSNCITMGLAPTAGPYAQTQAQIALDNFVQGPQTKAKALATTIDSIVTTTPVLVHNASAPNPCPAMNTQTTCATRTVMPTSWYPSGSLEMSGGGVALVVNTASRTNLQTPPWWSAFLKTPPYDKSSWEKGHCIASRFSGMTGFCNFTAQYEYVNQSIFKVWREPYCGSSWLWLYSGNGDANLRRRPGCPRAIYDRGRWEGREHL